MGKKNLANKTYTVRQDNVRITMKKGSKNRQKDDRRCDISADSRTNGTAATQPLSRSESDKRPCTVSGWNDTSVAAVVMGGDEPWFSHGVYDNRPCHKDYQSWGS